MSLEETFRVESVEGYPQVKDELQGKSEETA